MNVDANSFVERLSSFEMRVGDLTLLIRNYLRENPTTVEDAHRAFQRLREILVGLFNIELHESGEINTQYVTETEKAYRKDIQEIAEGVIVEAWEKTFIDREEIEYYTAFDAIASLTALAEVMRETTVPTKEPSHALKNILADRAKWLQEARDIVKGLSPEDKEALIRWVAKGREDAIKDGHTITSIDDDKALELYRLISKLGGQLRQGALMVEGRISMTDGTTSYNHFKTAYDNALEKIEKLKEE